MKNYIVDKQWYDHNYDTYISYESSEEFETLEEAQKYYEFISLDENEMKILSKIIRDEENEIIDYETIEESTQ